MLKKRRQHCSHLEDSVGVGILKGTEPVHTIAIRCAIYPVRVSEQNIEVTEKLTELFVGKPEDAAEAAKEWEKRHDCDLWREDFGSWFSEFDHAPCLSIHGRF